MPTPEEKGRRKTLKEATRQLERDLIRNRLPLPPEQMRRLFDFVDQYLESHDCDSSLTATLLFLNQEGFLSEAVVRWLQEAGAYCDCEVLSNAEERFLFAFPEINP